LLGVSRGRFNERKKREEKGTCLPIRLISPAQGGNSLERSKVEGLRALQTLDLVKLAQNFQTTAATLDKAPFTRSDTLEIPSNRAPAPLERPTPHPTRRGLTAPRSCKRRNFSKETNDGLEVSVS